MMNKQKMQVFWKVLKGRLLVSFFLVMACFVFIRWVLPLIHEPVAVMVLQEAGEHQIVRLRKNFDSGPVYALKIKLNGHLNGTAMIRIFKGIHSEEVYFEKMIGSGKVDGLLFDQDWYEDDCRMEYEPLSVTHGELKIDYIFKTSKPRS